MFDFTCTATPSAAQQTERQTDLFADNLLRNIFGGRKSVKNAKFKRLNIKK